MRIEAVTVSVGYADFLSHSLLFTAKAFDHLVVVTTPEDRETQRVCSFHDVHCVTTDVFNKNGEPFNKGAGINVGLKNLSLSDWVAHIDADIVLPPFARRVLNRLPLDPACVYGIDRMNVVGWNEWSSFLASPRPFHESDSILHLGYFPVGARLVRDVFDGYVPIGFFQLWNPSGSGVRSYPDRHTDAARGDVEFALNWPRERRAVIPELVACHLESEAAAMGANWEGRKTRPFGPDDVKEKVVRKSYKPHTEDDDNEPEPEGRIGFPSAPMLKHSVAAGAVAGGTALALLPFIL